MKLTLDLLPRYCHIRSNGCWVWTQGINSAKVPVCCVAGKGGRLVRREVWRLMGNVVEPRKGCVRVTCGTPRCVAPHHLRMDDRRAVNLAGGRTRSRTMTEEQRLRLRDKAIEEGKAKLTADEVRDIRRMLAAGTRGTEVSAIYGISARAVYDIRRHLTWRGIE